MPVYRNFVRAVLVVLGACCALPSNTGCSEKARAPAPTQGGPAADIRGLRLHCRLEYAAVNTRRPLPDSPAARLLPQFPMVRFSADGRLLAAVSREFSIGSSGTTDTSRVIVWSTSSWKPAAGELRASALYGFSKDSARLYTGSVPGQVDVWDTRAWRRIRRILLQGAEWPVLSNTTRFLAGSAFFAPKGPEVSLWRVSDGRPVGRVGPATEVLWFSTDDRWLAYRVQGWAAGGVFIAPVRNGEVGAAINVREKCGKPERLCLGPGSDLLVTGNGTGELRAWDFPALRFLRTFSAPVKPVSPLTFSPDGQLVVGAAPGRVLLWDVASTNLVEQLTTNQTLGSVVFSDDGRFLAVSSGHWIDVWQDRRGKLMAEGRAGRRGSSGDQ